MPLTRWSLLSPYSQVFVPHTDKYYEAKILKSEFRGEQGGWHHFLHYSGWNKKYDEWIEAVGLVKADQAAAVMVRG